MTQMLHPLHNILPTRLKAQIAGELSSVLGLLTTTKHQVDTLLSHQNLLSGLQYKYRLRNFEQVKGILWEQLIKEASTLKELEDLIKQKFPNISEILIERLQHEIFIDGMLLTQSRLATDTLKINNLKIQNGYLNTAQAVFSTNPHASFNDFVRELHDTLQLSEESILTTTSLELCEVDLDAYSLLEIKFALGSFKHIKSLSISSTDAKPFLGEKMKFVFGLGDLKHLSISSENLAGLDLTTILPVGLWSLEIEYTFLPNPTSFAHLKELRYLCLRDNNLHQYSDLDLITLIEGLPNLRFFEVDGRYIKRIANLFPQRNWQLYEC